MKRILSITLVLLMTISIFAGCSKAGADTISVISREDGSGTRDAFTELVGVLVDDVDNTVITAEIAQSTSVVITTVDGNTAAIGYISFGSLSDSIKALSVDGVAPSADTVKDGSYKIARPFNICYKDGLSELATDFMNFIMSKQGQQIISEEGYIAADEAASDYTPSGLTGTVKLAGSTSVSPVMDVLADAYKELNSGVTIEIQQSGSSAGISGTTEGVCDIGMSSRELKDSELAAGLSVTRIAMDGIAVIVNSENTVDNLTSEQIRQIYTGEITSWSELAD